MSIQDALAALDNCHYQGDISNDYWILDPIDGTLGFIHKAQFAIGLAYVHNGIPVVGVVGCPNLSFDLNAIQWNENVDQCGSVAVGISGMVKIGLIFDKGNHFFRLIFVKNTLDPTAGIESSARNDSVEYSKSKSSEIFGSYIRSESQSCINHVVPSKCSPTTLIYSRN